jgi:RNA polymerase sigma-70 factor (ECF subfamily)
VARRAQRPGPLEGRSTLKTWILRILTNRARTRGAREKRSVPLSSLAPGLGADEPAVDPDRFLPAGGWAIVPNRWARLARGRAARGRDAPAGAHGDRPPARTPAGGDRAARRRGLGDPGVSAALDVSEGNQRVLLHRARSKVRTALEEYFDDMGVAA